MWLDINEYNPQDTCAICYNELGITQSIYAMPCRHIFHNNCLTDYCVSNEGIINRTRCPICRRNPGYTCMDVWAFRENVLGGDLDEILPPHVMNIYLQQQNENREGGKRYLTKKKKNRKKIHKKSKKRKTKSNKTPNQKSHR